jgi:SPP1 gp7 family putative phage head morphogenesis protein
MPHVHNAKRLDGLRVDPTRTTLIRRRFQAEILRRIKLLKADVWDFLVTQDALGLRDEARRSEGPGRAVKDLLAIKIATNDNHDENPTINARPQPREFQFRTNPDKVKAFREWLQEQIDARILKPKGGADPNKPWTAEYVESAYRRGMVNSYIAARREEMIEDFGFFDRGQEQFLRSSFNVPELRSKIELLSTRAFEELRGVTAQMSQQMNRILAQGLADGRGVVDIAREMSSAIDGITRKRALVIARTEIINAHAEGQLDGFEALGVTDLGVMAEWSTALDSRVCPVCAAMEGKKFTVQEARGRIPAHPNCRCSWIPYVPMPGERRRVEKAAAKEIKKKGPPKKAEKKKPKAKGKKR